MSKKQILAGIIMALIINIITIIVYVFSISRLTLTDSLTQAYYNGTLSSIIVIGALPNLLAFFLMIRLDRDYIARGILIWSMVVAFITFIIKLS